MIFTHCTNRRLLDVHSIAHITSPESVESRYRIRENRLLNIAILGAHTYTRHRVRSTIHLNRKQVVPKSKVKTFHYPRLIKMDLSLNRVDYLQVSSLTLFTHNRASCSTTKIASRNRSQ